MSQSALVQTRPVFEPPVVLLETTTIHAAFYREDPPHKGLVFIPWPLSARGTCY